MKQKLTLVLSLLALTTFSFAQKNAKNSENKRRFAGIHLNSLDVATPQSWKDNSGTKSLAGFKNQDLGFSVSYWQTLAHHLDISGKATIRSNDLESNILFLIFLLIICFRAFLKLFNCILSIE